MVLAITSRERYVAPAGDGLRHGLAEGPEMLDFSQVAEASGGLREQMPAPARAAVFARVGSACRVRAAVARQELPVRCAARGHREN